MLIQPRIEVHIDSRIPLRQHAPPTRLLQLPLQDPVRAIRLLLEPLVGILVGRGVVVAEPIALPRHRTQRANEEEDPFLEVDALLLAGARAEFGASVVHAEDVVDHCAGFPGYDAGVGVFDCWDLSLI